MANVSEARSAEKAAPQRVPGEVSTERVVKALAQAAGDVLQRSPLSPTERMKVAQEMTVMAAEFEDCARKAWP